MLPRRIATILSLTALFAVAGCVGVEQQMTEGIGTEVAQVAPTVAAAVPAAVAQIDAATIGTAANPIVMSFVPSGEQAAIATGSEEIKKLLEAETGLVIEPNIATSYAAVIEAMGAGNAHVGWMPTFAYLLASEKHQVKPILVVERNGGTTYAGQIVAGADSGIKTIADLAGKTFCRPDALSTSGWIAPSIAMKKAGLDPEQLGEVVDVGNHDSVITAVYNKQCDAGATFEDARDRVAETLPDVKDKVLVIAVSDPIPNDNVSVVAGLPDEVAQKIADGLLALTATEAGTAALKTVYSIEKLQATDDTFYDDFRATLSAAGVDPQEYVK